MTEPRKRLSRQESQELTRAEVLRAAGRLFLRDGFVATSLASIAEEAGVTKGAVYSNFESKEDLFLTIVRGDGTPPARDALSVWRVEESLDADDVAGGFGRLGEAMARAKPTAREVALFLEYNVFALRNTRSRQWVRDHNRNYFEEVGDLIADALDVDAERATEVAAIAQSLYAGLLLHRAFEPDRFDDALFATAFRALASLLAD